LLTKIIKVLLPVFLAASFSVYGATPSYEGGTGLPYMRTADTVADGVLDLNFRTGFDKFEIEGVSDSLINSALGVTYGLTDAWELGVALPFVSGDGDGASGIPNFKIFTKARISGGRERGHSFGFNLYGTVLASDIENEIGSGEGGYGAELNFSLYDENFRKLGKLGKGLSAHFAIGREKVDTKHLGAPVIYTSDIINKLSLGLEYKPGNTYSITLEAIGTTIVENDDDNLLIVPSFTYHPSDRISYHLGAAFAAPDERSQPANRVFVGVSYSFFKGGDYWQRPIVEEPEEIKEVESKPKPLPEPSPFSIETEVHELPPEEVRKPAPKPVIKKPAPVRKKVAPRPVRKPVVKPKPKPRPKPVAKPKPRPKPVVKPKPRPRPVVKPKPRPKPVVRPKPKPRPVVKPRPRPKPAAKPVGKPRVEIWNASGSAGLAVKVAKRLRRKGYFITKVGGVKYYRKATTIYFGPGFEQHAKNLAKAMWQEGEIESTYSLHNKIDIQIIIGTDMKRVWKIWHSN